MKRDTRKEIIEAVYKVVAEEGVENTTTRKISVAAHTSENVMYRYFENKKDLFDIAFFELNSEIDKMFFEKLGASSQWSAAEFGAQAWCVYLTFWTTHRERALFYDRFIHSSYSTDELWIKQSESFVFFTKIFKDVISGIAKTHSFEGFTVLLTMVIESALNVAKRSINSGKPVSDEVVAMVCAMIRKILE